MIDDFKKPVKKKFTPIPAEPEEKPEAIPTPPKADIELTMDENDKIVDANEPIEEDKAALLGSNLNTLTKEVKKKRRKLNLTKKQKWIAGIVGGVVVILIGLGIFFLLNHKKVVAKSSAAIIKTTAPTTLASRLSGVQVSPSLANLPVTGVMIENTDAARPQSGLSSAGVVFEAVAEGGVTRFLALFEEGQPSSIGPVRSARPYYVDWDFGFDAAYAHVGGSVDGLNEIKTLNVKDLDEFYNASAYTRITSRQAPHNVYTTMSNLLALEKSKGWTSSNFSGFPRKADQASKTPTATSINMNLSGSDFNAHYDYDPTLNSYKRSEGGSPQIDANTNKQLEPKVVIAIIVPESQGALDSSGAYYSDYVDIGSGAAYVFQDGTVTQGIWQKTSPSSQITFVDNADKPIKLNAGQTWITALSSTGELTYTK